MDVEAALCFAYARANYTVRDIARMTGLDPMTVCRRLDRLILVQSRPSRSILRLIEADRVDDMARAVDQVLYGSGRPDVELLAERAVAQGLTPVDVAALLRVQLAASARRSSLLGLNTPESEPDDPPLGDSPEPTEWELSARNHRDEQARRIEKGEFDD
jgi:hypothetical protein